jgi:hypothetical protein
MVTTVTTATTVAVAAGTSLVVIAVVSLVAALIQKEMASDSVDRRTLRISRVLNIAIYPLLVVFLVALVATALEYLR